MAITHIEGRSRLKCPNCGESDSVVKDSRGRPPKNKFIYRRRRCRACATRFTTYEMLAPQWAIHGNGGGDPDILLRAFRLIAAITDELEDMRQVLGELSDLDVRGGFDDT